MIKCDKCGTEMPKGKEFELRYFQRYGTAYLHLCKKCKKLFFKFMGQPTDEDE